MFQRALRQLIAGRCSTPCRPSHSRNSSTHIAPQRVRLNGPGERHLDLNIWEPTTPSGYGTGPVSVLLYFPRGPVSQDTGAEESARLTLCTRLSSSCIVEVCYKTGADHQHPQPIYDAVMAFDWAVENLLPQRSIKRPGRTPRLGRIATCGELYGGTLAAMLALTECKIGQPGIVSAAVNNPILDWTDLSPVRVKPRKTTNTKQYDEGALATLTDEIAAARQHLFKQSKDYLDAFASPILFFRSSGVSPMDVQDDEQSTQPEPNEPGTATATDLTQTEQADVGSLPATRGPRYSHQFPSKALNLRLPAFHITTGDVEPVRSQGLELAAQLQKSFNRQRRPSKSRPERMADSWIYDHEQHADQDAFVMKSPAPDMSFKTQNVFYASKPGYALWDSTPEGQASLAEVTHWLAEQLNNNG